MSIGEWKTASARTNAPPRPRVRAEALAPYFVLAALVHLVGIASRFDVVADKLPAAAGPAILVVQFPLLLLSGYFESRLDYGEGKRDLPLWMQIDSRPVKLAFTFGLIYLVLIPLQTWDVSLGPLDPTPPKEFPTQQRAMWFAMFTVGMTFPFYLVAAKALIPVTRVVTWPLRLVAPVLAAPLALAVGFALGVVVIALVSSAEVGVFVKQLAAAFKANPLLGTIVSAVLSGVPLVVGLVRGKRREGDA